MIGGERYGQGAEAGPHRHEPQTDAILRANGCLPVVKPRSALSSAFCAWIASPASSLDQRLGSLGKKSLNTAISFFAPSKSRAMRE